MKNAFKVTLECSDPQCIEIESDAHDTLIGDGYCCAIYRGDDADGEFEFAVLGTIEFGYLFKGIVNLCLRHHPDMLIHMHTVLQEVQFQKALDEACASL